MKIVLSSKFWKARLIIEDYLKARLSGQDSLLERNPRGELWSLGISFPTFNTNVELGAVI
jgi:hypothetical protein